MTEPTRPIVRQPSSGVPQPIPADPPMVAPGSMPDGVLEWSTAFSATAPVATIFGKAFLEALAKRTAESVAGMPGKLRQRWFRRPTQNTGTDELSTVIDIGDANSAAILVTADLPDEARLALLDLDPTAPSLHGKVLGWNVELQQWAPVNPPASQVTPPSH
ncbi:MULTISPECIES: hypothetical protein [unclassified Nocardia]|uniref:hypothetical protein n=1 Tax=unclassified Nocardia TaxID=2637762 RepID=UPI001CE3F8BF|nr:MULTISPECIES: hypothetical protein [unclassified Nocardia]